MKKLLILFICLMFTRVAIANPLFLLAGSQTTAAPSECSGYLVCQNFEGVGYDNAETWTEDTTSGTVDEDYTTSLRGDNSLRITGTAGTGAYAIKTFTAQPEAHGFFRFRSTAIDPDVHWLILLDGSSNEVAYMYWSSSGTGQLRMGSGGEVANSALTYLASTEYCVWWRYATGAGTGIMQVWISTSETKPASPAISITNANSTANVAAIKFRAFYNADILYDQVIVSTTAIGDVPE